MKIITFTDVDWSCVRLWFSRAFPNMAGVRANADTADITDIADITDAKWEDIDALSKIEALYHASEDADPDNHAEFTT